MPGVIQRVGQFQRGLAAELHDHAVQRAVFLLDRRISMTCSKVSGSK